MEYKLVLLDILPSAFGMRVRIALAEKGIEYEYREEDLQNKSSLLLEMNPVRKMIPVLIHNGKPICESLIILQYIDELWHHISPLLPQDPYKRSHAIFWSDFIDKKIYYSGRKVMFEKGEEKEAGKKEFIESLKTIEGELGDELYFGGKTIGFLDVALIPYTCWFYSYETCGNFSIEAECPKLVQWANRCKERETISNSLTDPHLIYSFVLQLQENFFLT